MREESNEKPTVTFAGLNPEKGADKEFNLRFVSDDDRREHTTIRLSLEELITLNIWASRAIHEAAMPGYEVDRLKKCVMEISPTNVEALEDFKRWIDQIVKSGQF